MVRLSQANFRLATAHLTGNGHFRNLLATVVHLQGDIGNCELCGQVLDYCNENTVMGTSEDLENEDLCG